MKAWCGSPEHTLHRRSFLQGALAGLTATVQLGGVGVSAEESVAAPLRKDGRRVLFIWLAGGASQFEMWDPKPGRDTGGPFRSIPTTVPGYRVCELMPRLAGMMKHLAVVRSLNTTISEHEQAANLISTGRPKEGGAGLSRNRRRAVEGTGRPRKFVAGLHLFFHDH